MIAFQNGLDFIEKHQHSAFDRILGCGYGVRYYVERDEADDQEFNEREEEPRKVLLVNVLHWDYPIAEALFFDEGLNACCGMVKVDLAHQRRGIATAMFVLAEFVFGKPLSNPHANDRKRREAYQAFWTQPNRPFGNSRVAKPRRQNDAKT